MKNFYRILTLVFSFFLINPADSYGQLLGQIPLNPKNIPQFVDPLPHFAGLRIPASGTMVIKYEPIDQIALSTGTVLATGTVGTARIIS